MFDIPAPLSSINSDPFEKPMKKLISFHVKRSLNVKSQNSRFCLKFILKFSSVTQCHNDGSSAKAINGR